MIIGGLQKFSLLDYPGRLSAIVFTQGCNFRCPFCYNPMLVVPQAEALGDRIKDISGSSVSETKKSYSRADRPISEDDFFVFLKSRAGKLDAVVITGGEPTLHYDLTGFIARIKALDYAVKLDTNGTQPEMLGKLLENKLIDYVAMDIKGSQEKYSRLTGTEHDFAKIAESIIMIMKGKTPYEFRTTIVPGLIEPDDIGSAGELIRGAEKWFLQQFKRDTRLIDRNLESAEAYSDEILEKMRQIGSRYVKNCYLR